MSLSQKYVNKEHYQFILTLPKELFEEIKNKQSIIRNNVYWIVDIYNKTWLKKTKETIEICLSQEPVYSDSEDYHAIFSITDSKKIMYYLLEINDSLYELTKKFYATSWIPKTIDLKSMLKDYNNRPCNKKITKCINCGITENITDNDFIKEYCLNCGQVRAFHKHCKNNFSIFGEICNSNMLCYDCVSQK